MKWISQYKRKKTFHFPSLIISPQILVSNMTWKREFCSSGLTVSITELADWLIPVIWEKGIVQKN